MGMGVGAAMTGLRPIVEGMNMGFLLLAFNQISNNCGMLHYTSGGQFKVSAGRGFASGITGKWAGERGNTNTNRDKWCCDGKSINAGSG